MFSFGKNGLIIGSGSGKSLSPISIILATIVVSSLFFIVTRLSAIKVRREAFAAMKADALSGGVSVLDTVVLPSSDDKLYSDYFMSMP